jgi:hypothetical protein
LPGHSSLHDRKSDRGAGLRAEHYFDDVTSLNPAEHHESIRPPSS